jgi:transposase-like protein
MSERVAVELRRAILAIRRSSGRPRYPASVRRRAVSFARRRQAEGASQRRVALEIGVSVPALASWIREEEAGEGFRPVKAGEEAGREEERPRALSLVTPTGCRVEGLSLGDVAELLRVLG